MTQSAIPEWHHLPDNVYNPHAWIVGDPQIGEGCWIGAFTVIDGSGGLVIGKGCEVSSGAQIYTHSTVARVMSERRADLQRAPVSIGDYVHIGAGAVVLMGSEIGHHSIIGAGSVVLENTFIPPWSLAVGSPARIIRDGARKWLLLDTPETGETGFL
jgi:acetyltransferase-like isoleucine patch superfamily enzyme